MFLCCTLPSLWALYVHLWHPLQLVWFLIVYCVTDMLYSTHVWSTCVRYHAMALLHSCRHLTQPAALYGTL